MLAQCVIAKKHSMTFAIIVVILQVTLFDGTMNLAWVTITICILERETKTQRLTWEPQIHVAS